MAKQIKRQTGPANLDDFLEPPKEDMKKGVGSLLRSKTETEAAEPPMASESVGDNPGSQISIIEVQTVGLTGPQTVFRRNKDALVLTIKIRAGKIRAGGSPTASAETYFDANFQLLEYATNIVVEDSWWRGLSLRHGAELSISQGSKARPGSQDFTPPAVWGLKAGIYVFRPLIELRDLLVFCQADRVGLFRVK